MKIEKEEVVLIPIHETAHCEKCGAEYGEAVPLPEYGLFCVDDCGKFVPACSHRYLYTCPQCGATEESDEVFPRIIYAHRTKEEKVVNERR